MGQPFWKTSSQFLNKIVTCSYYTNMYMKNILDKYTLINTYIHEPQTGKSPNVGKE